MLSFMAEAILAINDLTKIYKGDPAVDGVSFSVQPGEIVGLLGPNGAGKTTTISMILGVLEPTKGSIYINGNECGDNHSECMKQTNFAAVYAQVPGNITVWQNLYVFGLLYNVQNLRARIGELIQQFDLERFANTRAGVLSSGEQTRVGVAKAFLNKPRLLLLDEPTASLDPSTAHIVRDKIREYVATTNAGILWTSHNMHEVEAVCDRVLFLSHGKILLEGDPKTLPQTHGKKNLEELFITVAREPLSLSTE